MNDAAIAALAELPSFYSLGVEAPDLKCAKRLAEHGEKFRELAMRNQYGLKADMLTEAVDWQPVTRFANLEQRTIMDSIAVDAASLQVMAAMPSLKGFNVYGDFSA